MERTFLYMMLIVSILIIMTYDRELQKSWKTAEIDVQKAYRACEVDISATLTREPGSYYVRIANAFISDYNRGSDNWRITKKREY